MNHEPLKHIELRFQEGTSDKVYRVALEASGDGFVVNFAYGRRGSTLNTGSKTSQPVSYAQATAIFAKLVKSKTAKGYLPCGESGSETGTGMQIVTDRARRDTGLRAQLLNPITEDEVNRFLDDARWCAQEKFDGRRMLLQRTPDSDTLIPTNRSTLAPLGRKLGLESLTMPEGPSSSPATWWILWQKPLGGRGARL